jgi:hypothetical protein
MSNVNVGTIFALESQIPTFSELSSLLGVEKTSLGNVIQSWGLFGNTRDNSDMLSMVHEKEREMLFELLKISEGDQFFETMVWLKYEMVQIRKIFREMASLLSSEREKYKEKLKMINYPNKKIEDKINKFYEEVPLKIEIFELELLLDELYIQIQELFVRRNKVKKEYINTLRNLYKDSSKIRREYLENDNKDSQDALEEMNKEIALKETSYISEALIQMEPTLVALSYLIKLKYFFYDLNLLISGVSNKENNLLIDYSFR